MAIPLAENIRKNRKERKLTQEQLAEVLGVTTGAVYKWEAGLSLPEIDMLMSIAGFFDCSVDALLGYSLADNRLEAVISRIKEYTRSRDPGAAEEAESALVKYPNSFELVFWSAYAYFGLGAPSRDEKQLRRALELMERALVLLPQNSDPVIEEHTVLGNMAEIYLLLGEQEKGIDLLKKYNSGGRYDHLIGVNLAMEQKRPDEAEPYLASGFIQGLADIFNCVIGYAALFVSRNDCERATDLLEWMLSALQSLKKNDDPDYTYRMYSVLLGMLAYVQKKTGDRERAVGTLTEAAEAVRRFDSAHVYGLIDLDLISGAEQLYTIDSLGETAADGVRTILDYFGDDEIREMWKEIFGNE